jgi:hypothetical protein
MKLNLSTSHAADLLYKDEFAGWSYAGALALCEYLDDWEEAIGEDIEFCPVAIRCDYSEYNSVEEAIVELCGDSPMEIAGVDTPEELATGDYEDDLRNYLQEHTTVIPFDGGVIVQSF